LPTIARPAPALSLPFVAAVADEAGRYAFRATSAAGTTFVTRDGALVHTLAARADGAGTRLATTPTSRDGNIRWSVVERFVGGSTRHVAGGERAGVPISVLEASGEVRDVASFRTVAIRDLYPGIDLGLEHRPEGIERVYRVRPDADPTRIRVAFAGVTGISVAADGRLELVTPQGSLS
jgi:hypothetical protein